MYLVSFTRQRYKGTCSRASRLLSLGCSTTISLGSVELYPELRVDVVHGERKSAKH